ncbi:hypothetical protein ACGF5M_04705 [Gemmatimonadota bacterium]
MIRRTAREHLLFEALRAGPEVTTLDGIRGHTASIEPSQAGPARIIRVLHGETEVCWAFSLEAGEARPEFYPQELPYIVTLPCTLLWDDENGYHVSWMVPQSPDFQTELEKRLKSLEGMELPEGMAALAADLPGKSKDEKIAMMRELRESIPQATLEQGREVLGDLPDTVHDLISEVLHFHESRGWTVSPEKVGPGASQRFSIRSEGRERHFYAMAAMGITVVQLFEYPFPTKAEPC